MKKTVSTLLICSLLAVFFCVPVNASTSKTVIRSKITKSSTVSNVAIEFNAVQFYGSNDNTQTNSGSGISTYYRNYSVAVTLTITNNNSKSYYLDNFSFNLFFNDDDIGSGTLSEACEIKDIHNFGPDIYVTMQNDAGNFTPMASADWSFLDHICIPANTTLTGVAVLEYTTTSVNNQSVSAKLSAITTTTIQAYETDFTPQGAHDDLLISLEALRSYLSGNSGIPLIDSDLDDILTEVVDGFTSVETRLSNIQSILTWAGSYNLPVFGSRSTVNYTFETSKHTVHARVYSGIPITDFEAIPPNVVISDVLYRIPVNIVILTNYTEDMKYNYYYLDNLFSSTGYYVDSVTVDSSWIVTGEISTNSGAYRLNIWSDNRVIPQGYTVSNIKFDVYSRNPSLVLNSYTVESNLTSFSSDVESQSDSLVNQSNQAHSQEQAFFNQNSQAIANSGLGNYQFSSDQGNGISVVTGLFNRLWNSVGTWNTVYVFSLTITVALTILRYTINAIKRRSYSDDKGGKP